MKGSKCQGNSTYSMRFQVKHEVLPTAMNTERRAIMTVASQHTDRITMALRDAAEWARCVIARAGVGPECASLLRFLAATINERWECPWNTQYLAVALNERESEVKHHLDVLGEQHAVYRFVSNLDGHPASVSFTLNRFYPQRANVWRREPWLWR